MVGLGSLLHFAQPQSGDILGGEGLLSLAAGLNFDVRIGHLLYQLEGVKLDVSPDSLVCPLPSDHPLGIKHRVLRIASQLVLGCVSDLVESMLQYMILI